jgi:uncharacterized protein (UPF0276 family)
MYYVCIENNLIISILNYEPASPSSVNVVEITDDDYDKISKQTHYFNIDTNKVEAHHASVFEQKENELKNAEHREFLNNTDWKVLRHIREKALGITTTLSEEQYLDLENKRKIAAESIV